MAVRSSIGPSGRPLARRPGTSGPVQVLVRARPPRGSRWLWMVLAVGGLGGGVVLLGLSFRLGLRLMLDPAATLEGWPQVLAHWQRSPQAALPPATTLEELEQSLENSQQLGEPLRLGEIDASGNEVLLVPVLAMDSGNDAGSIVSLHLFQTRRGELRAIASLPIDSLTKDTVLAPLLHSPQVPTAVPNRFPLTRVVPLSTPPGLPNGLWLTLEGTWQQQGLTLRYGQVLHFDPKGQRLTPLVVWSSPANQLPQWADLDGDGPSDLLVDETVGLDPALRGWQVTAGSPPRLLPVSWVQVPVDAAGQAGAYQQALRLARGGLWGSAQTQLADFKAAQPGAWNSAAEAQLRLSDRHAAITRRQADQDWSAPTQQILALLIDGRWEEALLRLEATPELAPALLHRLGSDRGRMWNRISAAAAQADPPPAVYVWGGLTLKAQQSQPTRLEGGTQDWLDRQPVPAGARQRLAQILSPVVSAQISGSPAGSVDPEGRDTPASTASALAVDLVEAFVGQARAIPTPQEGYAAPGQSFDPALGQWYAIDLRARRQPQGWQRGSLPLPFDTELTSVWQALEPTARPLPQILHWVSPTTGVSASLTLRGVTMEGGTPILLATGPASSAAALPPLAFSQGALVWLDGSQGQRASSGAIAAALQPYLAQPALFPDQAPRQHSLDITGDGQLDQVLTWDAIAVADLKGAGVRVVGDAPKTVILSANNAILYSDLLMPQTLVALTAPTPGAAMGLLVHRPTGYDLLTWATGRFE